MDDLYVIIGETRQLETAKNNSEVPISILEFSVESEMLDNSYRGFISDCIGICRESYEDLSPETTLIYDLMNRAIGEQNSTDAFEVYVYNRTEKKGKEFILKDNVRETVGEFMYMSSQVNGDDIDEFKTLEMYILEKEKGGI